MKNAGAESLSLAVELFNRPVQTARASSVLLLLGHAFEMLLKAAIYQARGRIRDAGEDHNYGFSRTISIARSDLGIVTEDDLAVLLAIKQDRDAAAHDTVAMGDDLLWIHVRSAVTIFGRILEDTFDTRITDLIPGRVVPVSGLPPTDARAVIARELQEIEALLAPNTRRGEEARARLRPLLALDGGVSGREEAPTEREVDRAIRALRSGKSWDDVFPGLASVAISDAPQPGSQEVALRVVRSGEGVPVRQATASEEDSALLYRRVDPFQEFNIKLSSFGARLGLSQQEGYAIIWKLRLKDDERSYFVKRTSRGNIVWQGLNARALHLAQAALDGGLDVPKTWSEYISR